MASAEGTSKADVKDKGPAKNEQETQSEMRKFFLPETGQVVEATNAVEAAKQVKEEKSNEG